VTPPNLRNHITDTYFGLRLGIVVFAFALPLVLYVLGRAAGIGLLPSMSDYYAHGTDATRDWFVGTLFAVGVLLYVYRGYSTLENVSLNIAGLLAVGVALFPCACGDPNAKVTPHGFLAVAFFVVVAFVSIKCAPDTLALIPEADEPRRARFQRLYRVLGAFMLASPAIAAILSASSGSFAQYRFLLEAVGVYTFAAYWLAKSAELKVTNAETLAAAGRLRRDERGRLRADAPPPEK